jgi:hypothetical protein
VLKQPMAQINKQASCLFICFELVGKSILTIVLN